MAATSKRRARAAVAGSPENLPIGNRGSGSLTGQSPEIQRLSAGLAHTFELYGSLKEGVHIAGYTLERAWNNLECLLEEDR
jgi:hypothetical protein